MIFPPSCPDYPACPHNHKGIYCYFSLKHFRLVSTFTVTFGFPVFFFFCFATRKIVPELPVELSLVSFAQSSLRYGGRQLPQNIWPDLCWDFERKMFFFFKNMKKIFYCQQNVNNNRNKHFYNQNNNNNKTVPRKY